MSTTTVFSGRMVPERVQDIAGFGRSNVLLVAVQVGEKLTITDPLDHGLPQHNTTDVLPEPDAPSTVATRAEPATPDSLRTVSSCSKMDLRPAKSVTSVTGGLSPVSGLAG